MGDDGVKRVPCDCSPDGCAHEPAADAGQRVVGPS
jgi:hypothetical protein